MVPLLSRFLYKVGVLFSRDDATIFLSPFQRKNTLEFIFVSCDVTERAFDSMRKRAEFAAIPFGEQDETPAERVGKMIGVFGIPEVVVY